MKSAPLLPIEGILSEQHVLYRPNHSSTVQANVGLQRLMFLFFATADTPPCYRLGRPTFFNGHLPLASQTSLPAFEALKISITYGVYV